MLEVRLLRDAEGTDQISDQELTEKIQKFFQVFQFNEELFDLRYLSGFSGFLRSATGRKVMNFVDLTRVTGARLAQMTTGIWRQRESIFH